MQVFLLWKNGIVTDGEAHKYIFQANRLVDKGSLSNVSYVMYLTQIVLIAFANKLKIGFIGVVFIQLAINLIATLQFYRYTRTLFLTGGLAFLATLLLLFNYPLQEFNTFLQTESIFYSLSIITSCYVLKQRQLSRSNIFAIILLLAVLGITRPTGILMWPPVLLYLFFRFIPQISIGRKLIIVGIGCLAFLFVLDAALGSGGELDFMLPYRDERIICGVPTLPNFIPINEASDGNSVFGLIYYVLNNFGQFTRLVWLRSIAFFGLVRDYYSSIHNIYLIIYFYSIYLLVLLSYKYWIRKKPYEFFYFLSMIILTWGTVILSCDDWHNRFFLTIFPYLILLGLPAIERFKQKTKDHAN